jgi:cytochrome P450
MSSLVHYEPYVDECADLFSQRLLEISEAGIAIDMAHWFQCYAFDVIGQITYAERLGFLDKGEDIAGFIKALDQSFPYSALVGIFPSLHPTLFGLANYIEGNSGVGTQYVSNLTQKKIDQHKAEPKVIPVDGDHAEPFVSKYLRQHTDDPARFTKFHILTGCSSNMIAGSDTTAISLSATLYYLLKTPRCLEKLRTEILEFQEQGRLSKSPTFKESQDMPYLQAVIKEALRMHPATGLPLERVVPEGGATISGTFFPEGVSSL